MRVWLPAIACVVLGACGSTGVKPVDAGGSAPAGPPVIAGYLVGADGQPVEGARVLLQPLASAAPVLNQSDPMLRTDARGYFAFDAPAAGRHQLLFLHPALGWLIAQHAQPGPPLRIVFDGKTRVIDVRR